MTRPDSKNTARIGFPSVNKEPDTVPRKMYLIGWFQRVVSWARQPKWDLHLWPFWLI